MPGSLNPTKVQEDTAKILRVWAQNTELKLKDVTLAQFTGDNETLRGLLEEIADKEAELTPLRNDRDALAEKLHRVNLRARAGIKGYFGEDSNQFELAGGTRASERKRPGPRPKPEPTAAGG